MFNVLLGVIKKQVCFLSSNRVGANNGLIVKHHKKGKDGHDTIGRPYAQVDYVAHFNGVDKNDRDSADYSTRICTIWYHIQIFCWVLDRVVHTMYVLVCYLVYVNSDWSRYLDKHDGI